MFKQAYLNHQLFAAPPTLHEHFNSCRVTPNEACVHSIESLSTLEQLLAEKRARKEQHAVLRFLVDSSGMAWFARETYPGIHTPKHFQMTGDLQEKARCITAGNIKFTNAKCTLLKNLNHKSGDFQPSFASLRIFLAILILNEPHLPFRLPKNLIIKELNSEGELLKKHKLPVAQIKIWVNSFAEDIELINILKKQDAPTKTVRYASTINQSEIEQYKNKSLHVISNYTPPTWPEKMFMLFSSIVNRKKMVLKNK